MPVLEIKLDLIDDNPYQNRQSYEDIEDLGRTIATDGLQQTPKARSVDDRYQLKNGHRRKRAFIWLAENWKKEELPDRYNGYTFMPLEIEILSDEQMLRGKAIENSQRKDPSAIEQMEEMKQFQAIGYTSEKIAELYPNATASTVRGLLAFDNLQPTPKEALHTGKISQGTARLVNTVQKFATPNAIEKMVNEIADGSYTSQRWNDDITPEAYIVETVEELPNVIELWWDSRNEKPHARSSDAWLLDMKKFPNQYLPMLTLEDALTAIGDETHKEGVQAWLLDRRTSEITEREESILQHLIEPTSCSGCPFYGKIKGTHYCGIKVCYERKKSAWNRHVMHKTSKDLGIAVYDPEADGNLIVLQDSWAKSEHLELFKKKGKDLRLAFMADIDRKKNQSGYSMPEGVVVGVVGETVKKLEKQQEQVREEKRLTVDVDDMVEKKQVEKAGELLWEATLHVKSLFDNFPFDAITQLYDAPRYGWGSDNTVPEIENSWSDKKIADHMRRELAFHMLDQSETIDRNDPGMLSDFATEVVRVAKVWGVKIPASFVKTAKEIDAEIEAVAAETRASQKRKSK